MAKKVTQTSTSRHAEADPSFNGPSLWIATDLIEAKDIKASTMKNDRLEVAKRFFAGGVEAILPSSKERVDWFKKGWVCLYFYPFDIGMPFPFSKLVQELFVDIQISPGQLMPYAWRVLAFLDAIEAKHKLGIDIDVVKYCYSLKKFNGCRFEFTTKRTLILNLEGVNDRLWSKDYFFVDKSSLGDVGSYLLERWDSKEVSKGIALLPLRFTFVPYICVCLYVVVASYDYLCIYFSHNSTSFAVITAFCV